MSSKEEIVTVAKEVLEKINDPVKPDLKVKGKKKDITTILSHLKELNFEYGNKEDTFQQYLENQGVIESVGSILEIIKKYKDQSIEPTIAEMNKDIPVLGSHLVFISIKLGEVEGEISKFESIKKLTRSRYIVEAKKYAESVSSSLTDSEADNISRILSEDKYYEIDLLLTVKGFLMNLMFNTRTFCDMIDHVASRMTKELLSAS